MMKKVLIYANKYKDPDGVITKRVSDHLDKKGIAWSVIVSDLVRTEDKDADMGLKPGEYDCIIVIFASNRSFCQNRVYYNRILL